MDMKPVSIIPPFPQAGSTSEIALRRVESGRMRLYGPPPFGASPSGKAPDFDSGIRRFESFRPSQSLIRARNRVVREAGRPEFRPLPQSIRQRIEFGITALG